MPRFPYRVNQDRWCRACLALSSGRRLASLAAMAWTWQLEDPAGERVDPTTIGVEVPEFENQGDAESWLGEVWRDLLERGIATVTLQEDGERVYGPMGLAAT
jgi:hypothetical protein